MMKKILGTGLGLSAIAIFLFLGQAGRIAAQEPAKDAKAADAKPADAKAAPPAPEAAPKEESSVTDHSIRLGGQTINY
jgi:hypothetical protein